MTTLNVSQRQIQPLENAQHSVAKKVVKKQELTREPAALSVRLHEGACLLSNSGFRSILDCVVDDGYNGQDDASDFFRIPTF